MFHLKDVIHIMLQVVGLVYVCFIAFVVAKPTPKENFDVITYSSTLVDDPVYYSYPYLEYTLYSFPYYDFAG